MRSLLRDNPIVQGLVALVVVGGAVALVLGLAAFAGARVMGFGGEPVVAESAAGETMYLPTPQDTETGGPGPLVSAAPEPRDPESEESSETADQGISLTASPEQASAMQQVNLTGSWAGHDGSILQVQKLYGTEWRDFAGISASVSGGQFRTYVQTGTAGPNKFRVIDSDTGEMSNEVTVTIG